ncbi:MAG: NUDIX hydrolase [Planctomycetes bacterium]|nr:NUDIX hydrolase [Planctomycetota bacterium]MDP6423995.1 NUDIX hydrolase [Planctomycetota bacterium]
MSEVRNVEVLRDRAGELGPRDGFLKLRRLTVRNQYLDGSHSTEYACDVVSRTHVDAVTVVLFERTPEGARVGLRENLRVPVWLRRTNPDVLFPDDPQDDTVLETVAGVLERGDAENLEQALVARLVAEAEEEVGLRVDPARVLDLGAAAYPSPGITDEKVFFKAAEVDFATALPPKGDGSTMEEVGGLVVLSLTEALARCHDGRIADMKTEIALRRLREAL